LKRWLVRLEMDLWSVELKVYVMAVLKADRKETLLAVLKVDCLVGRWAGCVLTLTKVASKLPIRRMTRLIRRLE
jgi:hypothetical protein